MKNVEDLDERMVSVDLFFNGTIISVDSEHTNALVCNRSGISLIFLRRFRDSQGECKTDPPNSYLIPLHPL